MHCGQHCLFKELAFLPHPTDPLFNPFSKFLGIDMIMSAFYLFYDLFTFELYSSFMWGKSWHFSASCASSHKCRLEHMFQPVEACFCVQLIALACIIALLGIQSKNLCCPSANWFTTYFSSYEVKIFREDPVLCWQWLQWSCHCGVFTFRIVCLAFKILCKCKTFFKLICVCSSLLLLMLCLVSFFSLRCQEMWGRVSIDPLICLCISTLPHPHLQHEWGYASCSHHHSCWDC